MIQSASLKKEAPFAKCSGSAHEMITQGGEYEFIVSMFEQGRKRAKDIKYLVNADILDCFQH